MPEESDVYCEPADWIVEEASCKGATLSRRQLADWHRADLIPKPDRNFLGGRDGTEFDLSLWHSPPGDRVRNTHETI